MAAFLGMKQPQMQVLLLHVQELPKQDSLTLYHSVCTFQTVNIDRIMECMIECMID